MGLATGTGRTLRETVRALLSKAPPSRRWKARALAAVLGDPLLGGRLPLRRRIALVRRGFLPERAAGLYRLDTHDLSDYVSDRDRIEKTRDINLVPELLDDKLLFAHLMQALAVPHPRVHAVVRGGEIRRVDGDASSLPDTIRRHGTVVVKPIQGTLGRDVHRVSPADSRFSLDGRAIDEAGLVAWIRSLRGHLVTEHMEQAVYARRIYPHTTNTLRIVTMFDGEPFIAVALHRFGVASSVPVDNFSRGGLCCRVDLATGTLGPGGRRAAPGRGLTWHETHPETGERLAGRAVPMWSEITDAVVDLAGRLPSLPYVGWDVIPTERGPVMLEGNNSTDVDLLQIHRPLLLDPRVRAFFARYGVGVRRRPVRGRRGMCPT